MVQCVWSVRLGSSTPRSGVDQDLNPYGIETQGVLWKFYTTEGTWAAMAAQQLDVLFPTTNRPYH